MFAVGFFKPHLPFAAPRRWFDKVDPDAIPVPAHDSGPSPESPGWHASGEMMRNYGHGGRDPREDPAYAAELRHAYAAATAYVDEQIGRVLDRLDALGLAQSTIVVIWSDHGFCLGEHGIWGKHALYEEALRAPLLIRHPGMPRPGEINHAVVESVDIFPTLTELAGLPSPDGIDGHSLVPQLKDPGRPSAKPALGWMRRGKATARTPDWRWIRHRSAGETDRHELFDYREDPDGIRHDPASLDEVPEEIRHLFDGVPVFQ